MKHVLRSMLIVILAFHALPLLAQQCTNGNDSNDPPPPLEAYEWRNDFVALTRLGYHYMPGFGDGDSMTEPFWLNGGVPNWFGSNGMRETWYIARDNLAGTAPFHRLIGMNDHMDSDDPNEAASLGYTHELTHGYPWTSQLPGTRAITRYLRGDIFDHRTALNNVTPAGYAFDRRWDTGSGVPRYGYQRFDTKLQFCDVLAAGYKESISNTKMKVDFNKIWGNAIGRITWKPTNTQLVREQIGAMVQSTLFNSTSNGNCCKYNPTQSGGADNANFGNTRRWAGSPVLSSSISGTTHTTEVKPLQYSFNEWTGTDAYSPLMWRGTFRRTTRLGYTIDTTTYEDVMLLRFEAKRESTTKADGQNMNNTFWLSMAPLGDGNLKNFEIALVDLDTGATTQLQHPAEGFNGTIALNTYNAPTITNRGILLSRADGSFAMGFHNGTPVTDYHVMYFCDGAVPVNGQCALPEYQSIVFNSFRVHTLTTSYGPAIEDTYFVVGDRATVIRRLKQLKCALANGGAACNSIQ